MQLAGAIFDLDGTLVDSMPMWRSLVPRFASHNGIVLAQADEEQLETMSIMNGVDFLRKKGYFHLTDAELQKQFKQIVDRFYATEAALKPGAAEFLERLREKRIPLALATATDLALVKPLLDKLDIKYYFTALFCCKDVGADKTSPLIYRRALEALGTSKEATMVFEDAFYAAATATSDGFLVAGMFDAAESRQMEMRRQCTWYFRSFSELNRRAEVLFGI